MNPTSSTAQPLSALIPVLLAFLFAVGAACTVRYDAPLAEGTPAAEVPWLEQDAYPFADETTRSGLLQIGRGLLGSSAWYEELWAEREALGSRVQLLVFGLDDDFFGRESFETWRARFPKARAIGLDGVGHFPQEEAPGELTQALRELLALGAKDDGHEQGNTSSRDPGEPRPEAAARRASLQ